MKKLLFTLSAVFAAALNADAKTFQWRITGNEAHAAQFAAYHGETVAFDLSFSGAASNCTASSAQIYYQTNGMGGAYWATGGLVFAPSNDCGAAAYRFFVRATDDLGVNYTANGTLRMLDSPGFVPNELELPRRVIDFSAISPTNAPWALQAEIEDISTNAAVRATSGIFRPFGDEYVYESTGMGAFEWSSDRADILAAVGSSQPYVVHEYDDYCEWHLDFSIGATNYYCSAYAPANSPVVVFSVDGWFWDEDAYEEHHDSASMTGRRSPQGWNRANPIDTFARQSEVTAMHGEMTAIRDLINGETKVLRTGKAGELGTGWGFVQHPLYGETRRWRIRVPKWGSISGMETNSATWIRDYSLLTAYGLHTSLSLQHDLLPSNPLLFDPRWDLRRTLASTRGMYGTDAVAMADWDVGLVLESTNGNSRCLANFHVVQTSTSPMSFAVSPVTARMTRMDVNILYPTAGTATLYRRDLVAEPISFSRYNGTTTCNAKAILLDDSTTTTTNGTFQLKFWTLVDCVAQYFGNTTVLTNALVQHVVTVACPSATTFEDATAPYYKIVSTRDSNLYYDAARDESFRVVCSNGVFFSEWHMDGDWRKEDL